MSARLEKLQSEISERNLDAFLITDNLNVCYLSGFTGSYAFLFATSDDIFMVTDFRYAEQAEAECPNVSLHVTHERWIKAVQDLILNLDFRRVGFEAHALDFNDWRSLQKAMDFRQLIPMPDIVGEMRYIKDEEEIALLKDAVRIADETFEEISKIVSPGMTEKELATEIDCALRRKGADKEAFDTIAISGARTALPHGKPTDRKISEGELILVDFGAKSKGYHSDITRTFVIGKADDRQQEIYDIVLGAQTAAIEAIRPDAKSGDIDRIAREYIHNKGYGDYFGHGLGHGLGLDVHDGRLLGRNSEITLEAGMVLTVEPGIYIPGWGGIRIEDDALVTDDGCEILTKSKKNLSLKRKEGV